MRAGILIIGSLLWDPQPERDAWRAQRLSTDGMQVKVPIAYRRRSQSRGNTYTMTFSSERPGGQGIVLTCKRHLADGAALWDEAQALWKAEHSRTRAGRIGTDWGCVGVLFRDEVAQSEYLRDWARGFEGTSPISPVDGLGVLRIPWPAGMSDDVDVILATATKGTPPWSPELVADAWLDNGHEEYFFENVRCGIRTPDDIQIWRRIEAERPPWLGEIMYQEAVDILRDEASRRRS